MKKVLIAFFGIMSIVFTQAQSIEDIKTKLESLELELGKINDSILIYQDLLKSKQKEEFLLNVGEFQSLDITTTSKRAGKIRNGSESIFDIVGVYESDEVVRIIGFENKYWHVMVNDIVGYTFWTYLNNTEEMLFILESYDEELSNEDKLLKDLKSRTREENLNLVKEKYGLGIYLKVVDGGHWIGMSKELAALSLGYPKSINDSSGSFGTSSQWVYDNMYLYFDNDKLTSVQYSR